MQMESKVVVYIVGDDQGHYKIGITTDLKRRMIGLQNGNPYKLRVIDQIPPQGYAMRKLESLIHKNLRQHRMMGEWYKVDEAELRSVIRGCKKHLAHQHDPAQFDASEVKGYARQERWRDKNRARYNALTRAYRDTGWQTVERLLQNPVEYLFERDARKRRNTAQACPGWADREAIRHIYAECVRLSRQYRIGMKVIHIWPIRGRKSSGLHIAENLRVVSESYAELYRGPKDFGR